MKKIIILFLVFQSYIYSSICFPDGMSLETIPTIIQEKHREHKVEFAFDIHNTLLEKNKKELKRLGFEYPYKWAVLANAFNLPIMAHAGYFAWSNALKSIPAIPAHISHDPANAEFFLELFERTKSVDLERAIITLSNAQKIKSGMLKLIQTLKVQGYIVRIASNIRLEDFEILKDKLSQNGQNIFSLFDVDARGRVGKMIENTAGNSTSTKPDPRYFEEYNQQYNPTKDKIIIFVDNRSDNITQAVAHGMVGVHFKNAKELANSLKLLGIF